MLKLKLNNSKRMKKIFIKLAICLGGEEDGEVVRRDGQVKALHQGYSRNPVTGYFRFIFCRSVASIQKSRI